MTQTKIAHLTRLVLATTALVSVPTSSRGQGDSGGEIVGVFVGEDTTRSHRGCHVEQTRHVSLVLTLSTRVEWTADVTSSIRCAGDAAPQVSTCGWYGDGEIDVGEDGSMRVTLTRRGSNASPVLRTGYRLWDCRGSRVALPESAELSSCRLLGQAETEHSRMEERGRRAACRLGQPFTSMEEIPIRIQDGAVRLRVDNGQALNLTQVEHRAPAAEEPAPPPADGEK